MLLCFMRHLVFCIPLLLIMNRFFGVDGLAWAQTIADIVVIFATYAVSIPVHRRIVSGRDNGVQISE